MRAVYMEELPMCDLCEVEVAAYDAPLAGQGSPWAYHCEKCAIPFTRLIDGVLSGWLAITRLVEGTDPVERSDSDIAGEVKAGIASGFSIDELMDLVGDGDVSEYI